MINKFIEQQQLPQYYFDYVPLWFKPLALEIAQHCKNRQQSDGDKPFIIGINGAQGTGKSTLAALLTILLTEDHHLSVAQLSLDDFYFTRSEREDLAHEIHPLLSTRGVPGTHDIALALTTIRALTQAEHGQTIELPRFNKAADDRFPLVQYDQVIGPTDVIIFEGWCVCAPPQDDTALRNPVNELEQKEDPQCIWRNHINHLI